MCSIVALVSISRGAGLVIGRAPALVSYKNHCRLRTTPREGQPHKGFIFHAYIMIFGVRFTLIIVSNYKPSLTHQNYNLSFPHQN